VTGAHLHNRDDRSSVVNTRGDGRGDRRNDRRQKEKKVAYWFSNDIKIIDLWWLWRVI